VAGTRSRRGSCVATDTITPSAPCEPHEVTRWSRAVTRDQRFRLAHESSAVSNVIGSTSESRGLRSVAVDTRSTAGHAPGRTRSRRRFLTGGTRTPACHGPWSALLQKVAAFAPSPSTQGRRQVTRRDVHDYGIGSSQAAQGRLLVTCRNRCYSTYSYFRSFIRPRPAKTNSPSGMVNSSTSTVMSWLWTSWTCSYSSKSRS